MIEQKFIRYIYLLCITFFALTRSVNSAPPDITGQTISSWISMALNSLTPIILIASVAMIIFGGYMYMASAGDPQKAKQAQGTITWAVIGLVFFLLIRVILGTVFQIISS